MNWRFVAHAGIGLLLTLMPRPGSAAVELKDKSVRIIYLVSGNRKLDQQYFKAINTAILDVQKWYERQLGGYTFHLNSPVVEVVHSSRKDSWFYQNPNGDDSEDWGYNNTLAEANKLLGTKLDDERFVWVIYSDGPGNKGRAAKGVACLPEDDLLGLSGQHSKEKNISRWIGGLAHELGHAFGLPHPSNTVKDADAIMWTGYYGQYPNRTYLTAKDKFTLMFSPFFFDKTGESAQLSIKSEESFSYDGGYFQKFRFNNTVLWNEGKTDSAITLLFREKSRNKKFIILLDGSRDLLVRLPLRGGASHFSKDNGLTWHFLYEMKKEK